MLVEMYTKTICPYCVKAKELLKLKGLDVVEYNIETEIEKRREMLERIAGARTVPQIFINNIYVGGCDNLYALNESGELDEIIKNNS